MHTNCIWWIPLAILPMSSLSCLECEVISETMAVILAQKHEVPSLSTKRTVR